MSLPSSSLCALREIYISVKFLFRDLVNKSIPSSCSRFNGFLVVVMKVFLSILKELLP